MNSTIMFSGGGGYKNRVEILIGYKRRLAIKRFFRKSNIEKDKKDKKKRFLNTWCMLVI